MLSHPVQVCSRVWSSVVLTVVCALLLPQSTQAASFAVNSRVDAVDAIPGDGVCATTAGTCTLRAAIQEANATAGADAITLPAGRYRLRRTMDELAITEDLTISGAGTATVINGNRRVRVFSVAGPANVTLAGLRIQRGAADLGGGLNNSGTVQLTDVVMSFNRATGDGGLGAALYNSGTMQLDNVSLTLNRSTGCGGGLFNKKGTVQFTNATINGNRATNSGGGVFNEGGTVGLTNVTVSNNRVTNIGGGIFSYRIVNLHNVTISGNRSLYYSGGLYSDGGTADLGNVTISGNRSQFGAALYSNLFLGAGMATLRNTIVSGNTPQNCDGNALTSLGHNLDSGVTCGFAADGDLNNLDPRLGPLRQNGGFSRTRALLASSPAIDAGDNASCGATDQRGASCPADGNSDGLATCDIGAYEAQP